MIGFMFSRGVVSQNRRQIGGQAPIGGQLTVYAVSSGSGTTLVNGAASVTADAGTALHWTRISDDGYEFDSWSATPPTTLTAHGTYTATYTAITAPGDAIDITVDVGALTGCTGVGDETINIQAYIAYCDTNSKAMLIPTGETFNVSTLDINFKDGFTLYGFGTLKRIDSAPTDGDDYIIYLRNSDNVVIPILHTDGNVVGNQPSTRLSEYMHSLRTLNCDNLTLGNLYDINTLGDALYINGGTGLTMETAYSYSSPSSGRNGLSIIDGNDITIENVLSYNIGVATMPGGFDIEPNDGDNVHDVHVHNVDVTNIATGFQISNNFKAGASTFLYDIFVDKAFVDRTHAAGQPADFGGIIQGLTHSTTRSEINFVLTQNNVLSNGPAILKCEDFNINAVCDANNKKGMLIYECQDFEITGSIDGANESLIHFDNYTGVSTADGVINMTLKNGDQLGTSDDGAIRVEGGTTLDTVTFSGNYAKDSTGDFAFDNDGTVTDCILLNLDITGFGGNTYTGTTITWASKTNVDED